jgi:protein-disulfide isomerase
MMLAKSDRAVTLVLTAAIGVMAVVAVRRDYFPPVNKGAPPAPPTYHAEWRDIASRGRLQGLLTAPVVVIEFADLECPGCRAYQRVLQSVKNRYGSRLAISFVHFPISYHANALTAARGAECAGESGRFHEFVAAVYSHQESLGVVPLWNIPSELGVGDSTEFARCLADTVRADAVIAAHRAIADTLSIEMTPTILVNGWRFARPPSEYYLDRFIKDQLSGKGPTSP